MSQQGKGKLKVWTSIHNKKLKVFLRAYAQCQCLCSLARFDLSNLGVRQPVQPHTWAPPLVFNKT